MPKSQRGSIFIVLILFFVVIAGIAGFVVFQAVTKSTKKLAQETESLNVALKTEYENPFEETTQYENPFEEYENPFEELK